MQLGLIQCIKGKCNNHERYNLRVILIKIRKKKFSCKEWEIKYLTK